MKIPIKPLRIIKGIVKGVFNVTAIPQIIDLVKNKKVKEKINQLNKVKKIAQGAKSKINEIRYGSSKTPEILDSVKNLLDKIDDGEINDSITINEVEEYAKVISSALTGGLLIWALIDELIKLF